MMNQRGERRSELRMQPNRIVEVVLVDNDSVRLGTLVDVSLSGARIKLVSPLPVGQKCELKFDEHQQRFACTVVWVSQNEMGVLFELGNVARADH